MSAALRGGSLATEPQDEGAPEANPRDTQTIAPTTAQDQGSDREPAATNGRKRCQDRPDTETPDYAAMMSRLIRAYFRRVGAEGDTVDLADMVRVLEQLQSAVDEAAASLHHRGWSWAEIARAVGTTRQAAWERWAR